MTKEAKVLIELIENNRKKARNIDSLENTMELAYLIALFEINECNYSEDVSNYLFELWSIRALETDLRVAKITQELEEINNEKL